MALEVGSRLGHYDVTALIGEGGMGQVYQAIDTKLNRQVALKILPEAFASDPDRLARFQREAQVLASLNHPNIAAIHGLEDSEGTKALVLELVEGPTLADRIAQGPIPVDEALPIATQIAEALEAAHEQGDIHRDLKPANIKVKDDGTVKVLDFGLAKALDTTPQGDPSQSPTLTAAATQMGVIMGTAAYMSPEQARGKVVDKRADIWSFGCVFYEMLTGQRAFQGEDVSLTLASVMKSDLNVQTLPPDLPANLRTVLGRCLEKEPLQRIRDVGDVRLAMEGAFETVTSLVEESVAPPKPRWRRGLSLAVTAAATSIVVGLGVWAFLRPAPELPARLSIVHPGDEGIGGNPNDANLALSPDGRHVAYVRRNASGGSNSQLNLYVRALDQLEPTLLSTTARSPFFSPDGQWVGFTEGNDRLSRVPVTGGPSIPIGTVGSGMRGASWAPDYSIVFATSDTESGLLQMAPSGNAEVLTTPDTAAGEIDHLFPEVLPGGREVLFTIATVRDTDVQGIDNTRIAVLDLATRTYRVLLQGGSHARYSASGHLVYGAAGTLRAVAFDVDSLMVQGPPVAVLNGVEMKGSGAASFGISPNGTLVYVDGGLDSGVVRRLVWVDRSGRSDPVPTIPAGNYGGPRLSYDGARLLIAADEDLWIYEVTSGRRSAITTDGLTDTRYFAWSPFSGGLLIDTKRNERGLASSCRRERRATATDAVRGSSTDVESWSPDGDVLAFHHHAVSPDIFMISSEAANPMPQPFLATEFAEYMTQFSPDGRFVAYLSTRSGRVSSTSVRIRDPGQR